MIKLIFLTGRDYPNGPETQSHVFLYERAAEQFDI